MTSSDKLEYDSAIGGSVVLPEHVPTFRYAAEHIKEIKELLNNIRNPCNTKLVFQSLPKHMRRRAMSHHPKRLPRKYRNIHASQMMKAGNPQQGKRPSRKYRRKPSNLMKEYTRRQRKHVWLETHIWHAKRFKMITRWGYKLPYASCDKAFRACYRASARHCLLQDISYYGCIEIKGTIDDIKAGFDHLTSNKCSLNVTAKAYTSGKREGTIDIFKADQYPEGALSKVNFIWRPAENILQINRTVWIFVHPSAYREIVEELVKVFQLISTRTRKIPIHEDSTKSLTKTSSYVRTPKYVNNETGIILTELKDTMNRFRLTGDLSQSVLFHAFKCKSVSVNDEPENWFKDYIESDKGLSSHKIQSMYWEKYSHISSPSELIPNIVVGLNIEDSRLNRPRKRTKALPKSINNPTNDDGDDEIYHELPENLCYSAIWDHEIREQVTKNMMSENEYCRMRNFNALVPGERCKFENELQSIPVLLIQRPGSQNNMYKSLGYAGGWDVIMPSGYGMSIWLTLIMWGAKPGGLREINSICRESGYDEFLPDSLSGKMYFSEKYLELKDKYFRLPPNKRCNYKKLSICSPFKAPFQQLVEEWNTNRMTNKNFYILREKNSLEMLMNVFKKNFNGNFPNLSEECLIQISIKMKTRGNPGNYSIICLPEKHDIKRYFKRMYHKDNNPVYIEPLKNDENEEQRKILRMQHKKLLKRLRARRVREKKKLQETSEKPVKIRPAQTKCLVLEHYKKMCELWLKENPNCIRNQCTRQVFGYVTQSEFSFTEAIVTGVGYVTVNGLKKLIEIYNNYGKGGGCKFEKIVLIRGTKSRNYRFASIKINPMV